MSDPTPTTGVTSTSAPAGGNVGGGGAIVTAAPESALHRGSLTTKEAKRRKEIAERGKKTMHYSTGMAAASFTSTAMNIHTGWDTACL